MMTSEIRSVGTLLMIRDAEAAREAYAAVEADRIERLSEACGGHGTHSYDATLVARWSAWSRAVAWYGSR